MVNATGPHRPERGTIGRSAGLRDYPMSTHAPTRRRGACHAQQCHATALLAAGILAPAIGSAESGPSTEQIITSLTFPEQPSPTSRGIRLAPPSASHGQSRAAAQAPTPSPAISLTVQFANGSAQLTPQAVQILDNLGRALSNQTLVGYRFRIEGHTDIVGSRDTIMRAVGSSSRRCGQLPRQQFPCRS
jgi:outer membrane protein OmpA-like peptidoglycan-associated protein